MSGWIDSCANLTTGTYDAIGKELNRGNLQASSFVNI